jgi:ParB family transcriptional regulator, chromosome partitioning protein
VNININLIKGSKNPIRTSEDKEKMDELVQSIAQQGLIVPIKVRPIDEEYEVVYGHRRLHACKELGLAEIECIVEGMEVNDQLVQSIIENMVREDMSDMDQARAIHDLMELMNWSAAEVAKQGITSRMNTARLLGLLDVSKDIQDEVGKSISKRHVHETNRVLHGAGVEDVLRKAIRENLNLPQTEKVAEAVKQAETKEERQAILDTPFDNPVFDRIVKAKAKAEIEHKAVEAERHMGNTQEVKEFLDAMKAFEKAISTIMEAIDYKRISPESVQYTVNRLAKVTESINDLTIKLMEAK